MIIVQCIADLHATFYPNQPRVLVPTMGALHRGHLSLIHQARTIAGDSGQVIVSLFVNPTQFDRKEDLEGYPDTFDADVQCCREAGVDILFVPCVEEMYASERSISITESSLSRTLCGKTRPGHFDGVCLICTKLFNLTRATDAVFGKKDFQQLAIIRRLVRDLNLPLQIHAGHTVREESGLALSSRNLRLSKEEKQQASSIYKVLKQAKKLSDERACNVDELLNPITDYLSALPCCPRLDYLELVDADTLQPLANNQSTKAVIAVAIFFGEVRLIDHIEL